MQQLGQKDFERIDEEINFVVEKNGKFGIKPYLNWLELRGAIKQQLNGDSFIVMNQFEDGGKYLYQVLVQQFEAWQRWKKNGRKVRDISNFGIQNESKNTKQENKEVAQSGLDLQTDFDKDIAAAFD